MPDNNYHVGDYALKATGNLSLACQGKKTSISCAGEEGSMMIAANKAVAVFSGAAFTALENDEPEGGKAVMRAGEVGKVTLSAGPPVGGVLIKLQGPELLEMSVGEPGVGASITMGPESITFKVAEATFTLTPEGIVESVAEVTREVTPEGHNFTAAETEMNIGVEGFAQEGPVSASEVEGGALENETLGSHTTDALKNEDAGIAMEI